ncbi:hypothetical protein IAT40_000241 [Kwoniella sp. CBS 6097]
MSSDTKLPDGPGPEPFLSTGMRLWTNDVIRDNIVAYLSRGQIAALLPVSEAMWGMLVPTVYRKFGVDLDEDWQSTFDACSHRRPIYLEAVRSILLSFSLKTQEIRRWPPLFDFFPFASTISYDGSTLTREKVHEHNCYTLEWHTAVRVTVVEEDRYIWGWINLIPEQDREFIKGWKARTNIGLRLCDRSQPHLIGAEEAWGTRAGTLRELVEAVREAGSQPQIIRFNSSGTWDNRFIMPILRELEDKRVLKLEHLVVRDLDITAIEVVNRYGTNLIHLSSRLEAYISSPELAQDAMEDEMSDTSTDIMTVGCISGRPSAIVRTKPNFWSLMKPLPQLRRLTVSLLIYSTIEDKGPEIELARQITRRLFNLFAEPLKEELDLFASFAETLLASTDFEFLRQVERASQEEVAKIKESYQTSLERQVGFRT